MQAVQAGLKRLRTGYIDVYLIHNFDPNTPISESMRAMDRLLQDGVVRAVGVSRYTLAQLAINWNLCQPGVTTALTGARRPEQVEENAGGAGWQISQDDLDENERIVARLTDLE